MVSAERDLLQVQDLTNLDKQTEERVHSGPKPPELILLAD